MLRTTSEPPGLINAREEYMTEVRANEKNIRARMWASDSFTHGWIAAQAWSSSDPEGEHDA